MSITGHSIKKIPKKNLWTIGLTMEYLQLDLLTPLHGDMAFKTQTRILKGGYRPSPARGFS